jgi:hypothetical protein
VGTALGHPRGPLLRRTLTLAAAAPLLLCVLGMGALGGHDATTPTRDYRARVTDVDGAHVDLTRLTVGGDTWVEGDLGRGHLRVPFDRITRIELAASGDDRDRLHATLTLRDGEPVAMLVRASTTFYGQMPSGAYQIRARDVRSVEIGP